MAGAQKFRLLNPGDVALWREGRRVEAIKLMDGRCASSPILPTLSAWADTC